MLERSSTGSGMAMSSNDAPTGTSMASGTSSAMDSDLEWAIRESLREAEAQQEHVAAQPGARVEAGVIVPPDVGAAQPLTSTVSM